MFSEKVTTSLGSPLAAREPQTPPCPPLPPSLLPSSSGSFPHSGWLFCPSKKKKPKNNNPPSPHAPMPPCPHPPIPPTPTFGSRPAAPVAPPAAPSAAPAPPPAPAAAGAWTPKHRATATARSARMAREGQEPQVAGPVKGRAPHSPWPKKGHPLGLGAWPKQATSGNSEVNSILMEEQKPETRSTSKVDRHLCISLCKSCSQVQSRKPDSHQHGPPAALSLQLPPPSSGHVPAPRAPGTRSDQSLTPMCPNPRDEHRGRAARLVFKTSENFLPLGTRGPKLVPHWGFGRPHSAQCAPAAGGMTAPGTGSRFMVGSVPYCLGPPLSLSFLGSWLKGNQKALRDSCWLTSLATQWANTIVWLDVVNRLCG